MLVLFIIPIIIVANAARDFKNYEMKWTKTYDFTAMLSGETLQDYHSVNSNTIILKTANSVRLAKPKDPLFYTSIALNQSQKVFMGS